MSRSATAAGTLILNGIHASKITGGASGALRQEFRELELLDDITTLKFNDKLPINIAMSDRRNILIDLFCKWKGENYIPSTVHSAIRWSKADPFLESQDNVNCQWRIIDSKVDKVKTSSVTVTKKIMTYSTPKIVDHMIAPVVTPGLDGTTQAKRKRINFVSQNKVKKVKFFHDTTADPSAPIQINVPLGTQWQNNSCAYDAIITVLFNMWFDSDTASGTASIEDTHCIKLDNLIQNFHSHESQVVSGPQTYTLEQIRDYFRRCLARVSQEFTFGSYTSVQSIAEYLFHSQEIVTMSDVFCSNGHILTDGRNRQSSASSYQIIILQTTENSLQACMDNFTVELASKCATCDTHLIRRTAFVQTPPLLAFDLSTTSTTTNGSALTLNSVVWISCEDSRVRYILRGVIYFDNEHFTERVVTSSGMIWYHNGIFTGRSLVYESQDLTSIATENAVMAFYIRSPEL